MRWIKNNELKGLIDKHGNFPVVVKGGGDRVIVTAKELQNEKALLAKYPGLLYIREAWVPKGYEWDGDPL